MKRKTGYYWVKLYQNEDWTIGYFDSIFHWLTIGSDELLKDEDFSFIGDQILHPISDEINRID